MEVKGKGTFSGVQSEIRNGILLLHCFNNAPVEKYKTNVEQFMQGFTMVTDGAADIVRVANIFASRKIHTPDES